MPLLKKYSSIFIFLFVFVVSGQNTENHKADNTSYKNSNLELKLDSLESDLNKGISKPQDLYDSVLEISSKLELDNDIRLKIKTHKLISFISSSLGKKVESYYNIRVAYEMLTNDLKNSDLGYGVVVSYGKLLAEAKDYEHALLFYNESLIILNTIKSKPSIKRFLCVSEIAKLYIKIGDLENALKYLEKSVEEAKQIEDKLWLSSGLNNIGLQYKSQGYYEKAQEYFLLAKDKLDLNFNTHKVFDANIDENIAAVFFLKEKYNNAYKTLLKVSKVRREQNSGHLAIQSDISALNCAVFLNKQAEAKKLIYSIDEYYTNNNLRYKNYLDPNINKFYKVKLFYYSKYNKYKEYKNVSKEYLSYLKEKHSNQEEIAKHALSSFLELQKHNFNNQLQLKKEIEKSQQRDISLLVGFLVLLVLVVTLLLMLMRIRKLKLENTMLENQTLGNKLKYKEKDIVNINSKSFMRASFLKGLLTDIKFVYDKEKNIETKESLKAVVFNLKSQIILEDRLSALQSDMTKANTYFTKTLIDSFPNLTKTEREVCSYIRLNLSIKEIAQARNSSVDSVKALRSRIRKKIGLSPETELDKFIQLL